MIQKSSQKTRKCAFILNGAITTEISYRVQGEAATSVLIALATDFYRVFDRAFDEGK